MKRFILSMFLILTSATQAFAGCDYLNQCPEHNYSNVSKTAQFFSKATGSTYLAEQFAQNLIEGELKKATGQDFKAEVKAISFGDLTEGKFKSLSITGKNIVIQGFYLSSLKLNTVCDYNSVDVMAKPIKFRENMVVNISAEISGSDLKNTLELGGYADKVNNADLTSIGIAKYKVYTSTINIENNKLYFSINATPVIVYPPLDVSIGADIKIDDGRITASRIDMLNLYTGFDLTSLANLTSLLKNLNYPINIFDNAQSKLQIQKLNIVGDKILLDGIIYIPKN